MTRSLLLSGAGRYADEWHDFAATSQRLASILGGLGHDVEISEDLTARLDELTGVDLLVVSDVLGHGVESYISAGHSALIVRSVQWLSRALPVSRLSMGEYREMSR